MKVKNGHRRLLSNCSLNWKMCGFIAHWVGRASHRYRGGLGFEPRWSPDSFFLLLSNCLNWKINCDDHSSLSWLTSLIRPLALYESIVHEAKPNGPWRRRVWLFYYHSTSRTEKPIIKVANASWRNIYLGIKQAIESRRISLLEDYY